jgi:methionyl-tRNA formyltransferase
MKRKKIVMCGCHEHGWEVVKYLLENGVRIDKFVSITKEKAKKLNVSGYKSFDDLSKKYSVPLYYAKKYTLNDPADISFFKKEKFDLLIQGGWQRLFPAEVIDTLKIGAVGVHGSSDFLPKGRGRSPINWSLIEGKKRFIIQYFLIKSGIDDGDIFHYEKFDINEWDDCRTLYYKNSVITKKVLLEWIPRLLVGKFSVKPQTGLPTYYPKRTPEDGLIVWSKTVFEIYNLIRALTKPYPGAFSYLNGKKIIIWKSQPFDTKIDYENSVEGEIVEIFDDGNFLINCNSGLLLVTNYKGKIFQGGILGNIHGKSS